MTLNYGLALYLNQFMVCYEVKGEKRPALSPLLQSHVANAGKYSKVTAGTCSSQSSFFPLQPQHKFAMQAVIPKVL